MSDTSVSADEASAAIGHNSSNMGDAAKYVVRIQNVQAEIDGIMAEAKAKCEPLRDDIKEIKKEATDAGFARKPFNAVLAARKAEAKAAAIRANLDEDHQKMFDALRHALGDLAETPLGKAALEAA